MGAIKAKRIRNRLIIFVLIIVLIGVNFACQTPWYMDQYDPGYSPGDYEQTDSFEIDPETILTALEQGQTNVFVPINSTPEAYISLPAGSYSWTQADYLKISENLFQYVWKEPASAWSLYQIGLVKRGCENNLDGFDMARVVYFKSIEVDGEEMYTVRDVFITPLLRKITWGKTWNYHPTHKWKEIIFEGLQVTADDALLLAENNGGKDIRLRMNNKCNISVDLAPDGTYSGWRITYIDENARTVFAMSVDPSTGEYEIDER